MPAVWGFCTRLFAIADCVFFSPPTRVAFRRRVNTHKAVHNMAHWQQAPARSPY